MFGYVKHRKKLNKSQKRKSEEVHLTLSLIFWETNKKKCFV